jgi:hypothetical protein
MLKSGRPAGAGEPCRMRPGGLFAESAATAIEMLRSHHTPCHPFRAQYPISPEGFAVTAKRKSVPATARTRGAARRLIHDHGSFSAICAEFDPRS